jgi:hypothetical protein
MGTHRTLALVALAHGIMGLSHVAIGQDRPDSVMVAIATPRWTTGSLNVQFGVAGLGLDELNGTLTANGRPPFSTSTATIGIAGYARFGRLLVGVGGESALPQRDEAAGWTTRVSFGSAMVDAGYVILDRSRLIVYPHVSIGVRATSLTVQRVGDFTFTDGVRDPARGVELSSRGALAGVGLVAETHLTTSRTGDFSIGVRAGLVTSVGAPGTIAGERTVSGAPHEASGWHVRLTVGRPIGRRRNVVSALSTALVSLLRR